MNRARKGVLLAAEPRMSPAWAQRALLPLIVEAPAALRLLRVVPDPPEGGGAGAPEEQARLRAHRDLEALRKALEAAAISVRYHIARGDAAREILRFADQSRPALLVLAKHHSGDRAWWRLGSVAERVLRRSRHPLLLLSPDLVAGAGERGPFRRVLAPLDGSARAARILPLVRRVAGSSGAEVVLLHCREDGAPDPRPPASVREAEATLRDQGISVEVRVGEGSPAREILVAADAEGMDLLAATTHGRDVRAAGWRLGPVAEKVLRSCPASLLVLPDGTEMPEEGAWEGTG